MDRLFDCAIIGGGPGGLVSALYLRRFERSVALIRAGVPRAALIPRTHNLIGYDRGISGKLLLRRLERQLSQLDVSCFSARAKINIEAKGFSVELEGQRPLRARTVILATGMIDNEPALENLKQLRELGLLRYCSICDGYEYRRQPVAVLANDDFGIQKGLFISHWTKNIRFLLPKNLKLGSRRISELKKMRAKVSRCDSLKILPRGGPGDGVDLFFTTTGRRRRPVYAKAVYVELGCVVNDSAFGHLRKIRRSKEGFIITTTEQRTTVPGLFAVGDCVNLLGQISVAAGQAAVAATTIHNDLF